jgi:hypothetical protein
MQEFNSADVMNHIWLPPLSIINLLSGSDGSNTLDHGIFGMRFNSCSGESELTSYTQIKLSCRLDFWWYPFDTQVRYTSDLRISRDKL